MNKKFQKIIYLKKSYKLQLPHDKMTTKICKICNEEKDITTFVKNNQCKTGYLKRCKPCENTLRKRKKDDKMKNLVVDETKNKTCFECKKEKNITNFAKSKSCKDGYRNLCKECKNDRQKKVYKEREQDKTLQNKKCKECDETKEIKLFTKNTAYKDGYEQKCVICYRKNRQEYLDKPENRERFKKWCREWESKPENKKKRNETKQLEESKVMMRQYIKKYRSKDSSKKLRGIYRRERYSIDIEYKITCLLRSRLHDALKGKMKVESTMQLLGCSLEHFKNYIESLFVEGMTWENHGEWHLDHIRPCASFNFNIKTEQRICFNWRNMQPLWGEENLSKSDKWEYPEWKKEITAKTFI
jgi:hypothetical protein